MLVMMLEMVRTLPLSGISNTIHDRWLYMSHMKQYMGHIDERMPPVQPNKTTRIKKKIIPMINSQTAKSK